MYLPVAESRSASGGISVDGLRFSGSLLLPRCLSSSASRFFLTVGVGERATEGTLSCENWRELTNVGNEFTVDGLCGIQESMKTSDEDKILRTVGLPRKVTVISGDTARRLESGSRWDSSTDFKFAAQWNGACGF